MPSIGEIVQIEYAFTDRNQFFVLKFFLNKVLPMAGILAFIGLFSYWYLGGFEPLNVEESGALDYPLMGKYYEGSPNAADFREIFESLRDQIKSGQMQGPLVLVDYGSEDSELIQVFVGAQGDSSVGAGWERNHIRSSGGYEVSLGQQVMVKPRPEEVVQEIRNFADQKGRKLANYSLELYFENEEIKVQVPFQP
ncbi:hypothetical protein PEDI_07560 [Persicobacter diffluens]|uniref:Uncharacterized protein n=1 Tax=Persicobacter diffluens TaxID=981 RepID=A0AAN5AIT3_9BACT|nr:hypothetical protein PEDI_07560 [Persicobacter diffluens]